MEQTDYSEAELLAEVSWFSYHIARLCLKWGGTISSWGRTKEYNDKIKGAHPKSLHLWFLAVDPWFPTVDRCRGFFAECVDLGMGGYIRESKTSCHVQRWPKGTGPRP